MNDPVLSKYSSQFVDAANGEPVAEHAFDGRVVFYMGAWHDEAESALKGRPVFVEAPFVKMVLRDDPWSVVDRPAHDLDRRRFPVEWARFENERAAPTTGTPLNTVPWMTPGPLATLAAMKVRTVEALADESDARLGPELAPLKQKARDFIAVATGLAPVDALRAEVEALRAQLAAKEQAKPKRRPRRKAEAH